VYIKSYQTVHNPKIRRNTNFVLMEGEKTFVEKLLKWHERNKRAFAWRDPGRTPFEVLVAEVMLQKTFSTKVEKIYEKFIEKYPSPWDLAKSSVEEITDDVRQLGLQEIKANALREIGRKLVEEFKGRVPETKEGLLSLPGVGEYTANAVMCFAYGEDVPIVDANVSRVVGRFFFGSDSSLPPDKKESWEIVGKIIPKGRCREFNFALLDFAASICTARTPKHETCPLANTCRYVK